MRATEIVLHFDEREIEALQNALDCFSDESCTVEQANPTRAGNVKLRRVSPCAAPCGEIQPESDKHKPCESKEPFGTVFAPFVPKSAGGTKISRRKRGVALLSPRRTQRTATPTA